VLKLLARKDRHHDNRRDFDLLAAEMGGLVRENRDLLSAYRQGFA
jgi:hypothetical protein